MGYVHEPYDVIVVGAGHAGWEAALAAARMGAKTAIFTMNLDSIANMPCNPEYRRNCKRTPGKGNRCLGGEMGKCADKNADPVKNAKYGEKVRRYIR